MSDGVQMRRIRAFRKQTEQEFANDINERLRRRYDKSKITKWENGRETIPPEVAGLMLLWNLGYVRSSQCKTVVTCLRKGGTSKSTTTTGLGHVLAAAGARTLVVDLDSQSNASMLCGVSEERIERLASEGRTLYHALRSEPTAGLADIILETPIPNLHLAPSSEELAVVEMEMNDGSEHSKRRLRKLLQSVAEYYDFILIDTSPSLGPLTVSALTAATYALIPCLAESLSISGLRSLYATIDNIRDRLNGELEILGILPAMIDYRLSADMEGLEVIRGMAGSIRVFEPIPKATIYVKAAQALRITHHADTSAPGLTSYIEIAKSLGVTENVHG